MDKQLLELLSAELQGTTPAASVLTAEEITALSLLARKHDLAHLVSHGLYRLGVTVPEKLRKEEIMAVYRYERMERAFQQICGVFEEQQIPYIPLKGAVIRKYYPEPWMRTSCDIDILVCEEDLDRAVDALTAKGYRSEGRNYHDVSLFSPGNVHLELHFCILENRENLDGVLQKAWEFARPVSGCRHEFAPEFFLFHLYAHASYHFLGGGCGLRTLMDLWILEHKMGIPLESARLLLEQAGIWTFARELQRLSEACFSGAPGDDLTERMLSYILTGGVYGTQENKAAVDKSKSKSTALYALGRLFMPYRSMKIRYPVLNKWPILLPVYWVVRMVEMLIHGRTASSLGELQTFHGTTDAQAEEIKALCRRLELY